MQIRRTYHSTNSATPVKTDISFGGMMAVADKLPPRNRHNLIAAALLNPPPPFPSVSGLVVTPAAAHFFDDNS